MAARSVARFRAGFAVGLDQTCVTVFVTEAGRLTSTRSGFDMKLSCKPLDFGRHGRREEQRLPRERDELGDPLDVGDEAHIEHAVGFVDDEDLDAGEEKFAAFEMIEQAARRRDQDVGAAVELLQLLIKGDAADEERDRQLVVLAVADEVLLDLRREFTRRLQDQRARHARPGPALLQPGQHRQHEGGRLARAGLGDAQDVSPGEDERDRLLLDRSGFGVSRSLDRGQDLRDSVQVCQKALSVCSTALWPVATTKQESLRSDSFRPISSTPNDK